MRNADDFEYSEIYFDEFFEYRHVTGPKELESRIRRLLKEVRLLFALLLTLDLGRVEETGNPHVCRLDELRYPSS